MGNEIFRALNVCVEHNQQTKLQQVSFSVDKGEIFGIFGMYDSGKRTLLDVITGKVPINEGLLFYNGIPFHEGHPDLHGARILRISHHSSLIGELSLWENLVILRKRTKPHIFLNKRYVIKEVNSCFKAFNLGFSATQTVKSLSALHQLFIELLRSYFTQASIILLDDFSMDLRQDDLIALSDFMQKLKQKGISIIVTSRKLSLLKFICDQIAFLSAKSIIHTVESVQNKNNERFSGILMHMFPDDHDQGQSKARHDTMLFSAKTLRFDGIEPMTLTLNEGEVTALIDPFRMVIDSLEARLSELGRNKGFTLNDRLTHKIGWKKGIIFTSFNIQGTFFRTIPIIQNLSLPVLYRCSRFGLLKFRLGSFIAKDFSLNYGNQRLLQQNIRIGDLSKSDIIPVLLYRLRLANPQVIFCQDPWNDTDYISVKLIYRNLTDFAHDQKRAVCFLVSGIENLEDMADRYLVVARDGSLREVSFQEIRRTLFGYDSGVGHA